MNNIKYYLEKLISLIGNKSRELEDNNYYQKRIYKTYYK